MNIEILDQNFKSHKIKYLIQCLLATLCIFIILILLDAKTHSAIITSFGASVFLVFAMPRSVLAKPRFLIGGYITASVSGWICHSLSRLPNLQKIAFVADGSDLIFGAMSVGIAIFLMVILNTEHPPAAGLALALVFNEWTIMTLVVILVGICLLSIMLVVFRPLLIDLL